MKKYVGLLMITLFTLVACGDKKEVTQKTVSEIHVETPKPVPKTNLQPETENVPQNDYVPVEAPQSDSQNGYKTMPEEPMETEAVAPISEQPIAQPESFAMPESNVQQPENATVEPTPSGTTDAKQNCQNMPDPEGNLSIICQ